MKKSTLSLLLVGAAALSASAQQQYVVFEDDFSWLIPWAEALNADGQACGDPIGTNDVNAISRALNNIKLDVDGAEMSAQQKVQEMGYNIPIKATSDSPNKNAWNCTFLQRDLNSEDETTGVYFLFGRPKSSTGLTTPALEKAGEDGVSGFTVSFDWCPDRQADGKMDVTHLSVCVNDITTVGQGRENVPDHDMQTNDELKWRHVDVKFENYTLKGTDKITIRPGANQWPSNSASNNNARFFFRNLKITTDTPISTDISEISSIVADDNAPVEYYNLQGIRIAEPAEGLCIVRQGNKVTKKFIRK